MEATVLVLFIVFLLPKSRRLTLIGKIYEPRQVGLGWCKGLCPGQGWDEGLTMALIMISSLL